MIMRKFGIRKEKTGMRCFDGFQNGVNLGGWISQFDHCDKEHFDTFIREEDIQKIAGLGYDHVRVPVDYNVLEDEDGNPLEEGFGYLEKCREWCSVYGLNMLIDLHECYGYSFDPLKKDMDRRRFFFDEELQARFLKLWERIANRFKEWPEQVAFEPLNEVVLAEVADAWNRLLGRYVRLMRSIAPDSWLVVGGVQYNNVLSVPLLDVPVDSHIVYNFHCYEPMVFTHQGAYWMEGMPLDFRITYPRTLDQYRQITRELATVVPGAIFKKDIPEIGPEFFENIFQPAIAKAQKDNVPLYCGEFGVIDLADEESIQRWLNDIQLAFEKYRIGHARWNYKEKDFGLKL